MFRADMVRASLPFAATAAAARLALAPDAAGRLAVERGLVRLARLVAEEAREGRAGGGAVAAAAEVEGRHGRAVVAARRRRRAAADHRAVGPHAEPGPHEGDATSLQRECAARARSGKKRPRFEAVPRDDRSSKNQPKRVEHGRERSL